MAPVRPRRFRRRPAAYRRYARTLEIRAGAGGLGAVPVTWRGFLRFPADRIHKSLVEAVTRGYVTFYDASDPTEGAAELSRFAYEGARDRLSGTIGFRIPPSPAEQSVLERDRPLLIKLQYVLWARALAETDGDPERPVVVTLAQLCEDLGYVRLRNGAHRPEHKRRVREAVELLTALTLEAEYRAPDGRTARLAGPIWRRHRHLEAERTIAYSPGTWFAEPAWVRFNRTIGLVGAGLRELRPDRDQWAIAVGGYAAALARMNGYRPLTLRVSTLLERSGLAAAERRNPARMREMLERALDRLEVVGVIGEWDWFARTVSEPDMDAPHDLAALTRDAGEWSSRSIVLRWPAELQRRSHELTEARRRYWQHRRRPAPLRP